MTSDHLAVLLAQAEVTNDAEGWTSPKNGRELTLHVAVGGVGLAVSRVEALKLEGPLLTARTSKGELYVIRLEDIFMGAVDAPSNSTRKAGFV